jgi:predicted O-methyltransferase YrrM
VLVGLGLRRRQKRFQRRSRHPPEHVAAAGLSDRVEFRAGDALETLRPLADPVDLVRLDGAFAPYLPVLKTVEARLTPGDLVISESANAPDYLEYVRNPANGYLSQSIPFEDGRGNELTVYTG